ncbi:MAG: hypothetical protein ABIO92_03570 [Chloroflexia bacterium]
MQTDYTQVAGRLHLNWLGTKKHLQQIVFVPASLEALHFYYDFGCLFSFEQEDLLLKVHTFSEGTHEVLSLAAK